MHNDDFSYDPVTAVDEATATGETAAIFGDIRATMQIPLVTSIWRGLAGMGDSLRIAWDATRPIYAGTDPATALANVVSATPLPCPAPLAPTQLHCLGLSDADLAAVRTIVAAYNRSNGMNMVTLAALVSTENQTDGVSLGTCPVPTWSDFPQLLAQSQINPDTWALIQQVNAFGAAGPDANVATLWRHLAHWPALLALIFQGFAPLHAAGDINAATAAMVTLTRGAGANMTHLRGDATPLSDAARGTITGYVHSPTQVVRMVTMGHALAQWLR